jgi:GT2 family glycosyltransferase
MSGISSTRRRSSCTFSIVIATCNAADTLARCLESIFSQTFEDYEVLLVDAASTDETVAIIRRYEDRIAHWVSEPDRGVYDAWNKGVVQARGEWVCFLGADDCLRDRSVLEQVAERLPRVPDDVSVVYGRVVLVNGKGRPIAEYGQSWEETGKLFRQMMSVPHPGTLHRRALFERHGLFDVTYRIAGDYEFLLRELREGRAFFMSDVVTVHMGSGGMSTTPRGMYRSLLEVRRAQVGQGLTIPSWAWTVSYLKAVLRLALFKCLGDRLGRRLTDMGRALMGKAPFWTVND